MLEHIDRTRFVGRPVGVILGGDSPERPVSLETGDALASALEAMGWDVTRYDFPEDMQRFIADPPAAAVLGLHGGAGEDGTVQGFLNLVGVTYTGSGVLASAVASDKVCAKAVMRQAQVPLAAEVVLSHDQLNRPGILAAIEDAGWAQSPVVFKPSDAGSSIGVFVLHDPDDLEQALTQARRLLAAGDVTRFMLEEFLAGPEYSVGFFGDACLGSIQITPAAGFYDFHAKYEARDTVYTPVEDEQLARRIEDAAKAAWRALGGRSVGRVDVMGRDAESARVAVLEANTVPGMTATSLVPKLAQRHGISFEALVELMLSSATTDREVRGAG
ncbi:MAG: D-alanine--D-alanine ligase [Myxococcota bacterium]